MFSSRKSNNRAARHGFIVKGGGGGKMKRFWKITICLPIVFAVSGFAQAQTLKTATGFFCGYSKRRRSLSFYARWKNRTNFCNVRGNVTR
jgi:hypothetical protein